MENCWVQPSPPGAARSTAIHTELGSPFLRSHSQTGGPLSAPQGKFLDTGPRAVFENVIISQLFWPLDCLSSDGGLLLPPAWPEAAPTQGPQGCCLPGLSLAHAGNGNMKPSGPFPTIPLSVFCRLWHTPHFPVGAGAEKCLEETHTA